MTDDDGRWRTTEAYRSYKLTKWAFGSGELKNSGLMVPFLLMGPQDYLHAKSMIFQLRFDIPITSFLAKG